MGSEQQLQAELAELGFLDEESPKSVSAPETQEVEGDSEAALAAQLAELGFTDEDNEVETQQGPVTQQLNVLAQSVEAGGDINLDEETNGKESEPEPTPEAPEILVPETEPEEIAAAGEPETLSDQEAELARQLAELGFANEDEEEPRQEPEEIPEPEEAVVPARSRSKLRGLLGILSSENRPRPIRALRERLARENGISLPSRDSLSVRMPDLSGLLDFLPSKDKVPSLRQIKRRMRVPGQPELTDAQAQQMQDRIRATQENAAEVSGRFQELTSQMKDVPWQTMVLTSAKPVAKVAAVTVLRSTGRDIAAVPLAQVMGASSVVNPIAAAAVAGIFDTVRVVKGGSEGLYASAAQDTLAGLTTWRGKERKGSESQAEFDRNKLKGKYLKGLSGLPLFALRKIGVAFNALRSANTQVWMGVTRDRATVSKELGQIDGGAVSPTNQELTDLITQKLTAGDLSKDALLRLARPLARLRAMQYGAVDVAGKKGKIGARVAGRHTAGRVQQLHEVLNQMVQNGDITLLDEERQAWDKEYEDVSRKTKDKVRKLGAVTGNAVATFATVGAATWIPLLADKLEQFDLEEFKARITEQFETSDATGVLDSAADSPDPVPAPEPEPTSVATATPEPTTTPTPDATETPTPDFEADFGSSDAAETTTEVSVENDVDIADATDTTTDTINTSDVPVTVEATTTTASTATETATHQSESFGLGTNRIDTDSISTDDATEIESGEVAQTAETASEVDLEDAIEIQNLGDDELPWNAIFYSIKNNPSVDVSNINGTTNVIKNIYKALNHDLPTGAIAPDSGFAILPDAEIPTELPDGAVAYFFSEEQIENLAEQIDAAIKLSQEGAELTDMQEALVQLNGGALSFEDLAENKELLEDILEIATER